MTQHRVIIHTAVSTDEQSQGNHLQGSNPRNTGYGGGVTVHQREPKKQKEQVLGIQPQLGVPQAAGQHEDHRTKKQQRARILPQRGCWI